MNEVANFVKGGIKGCSDNKLNYPPFTPRESEMLLPLDLFIADSYQLNISSPSVNISTLYFHSALKMSLMT